SRRHRMKKEFLLPDIGEGLIEGEIVKWFVKEGQEVKENDPLVEVLTEKVNVEIPSPYTGTVLKILAEEGQVVNVGDPIVVVGEKGEAVPEVEAEAAPSEEAEEVRQAPPERKVLSTPAVRRLARELGVDLSQVRGTGTRGRISAADVEKHAEVPELIPTEEVAPAEEAVPAKEELVEKVPIHGVRRTISDRMHRSKTTAAHFTYVEEVDVTELVALRERARTWADEKGVRLTFLPFMLKALVAALKEHPSMNATIDWEKNEVHLKKYYNIGIATATDQGLLVPIVKDVDRKTVLQVAREVEELSEKARSGKLSLNEVQDSTFTVTSLGAQGGLLATPIINHPEVAILGIHKIAKRPVVKDGRIVIREMMNVSLSFDHRIIDGHVGAAFTQTLVRYLEDPGLLLLQVLESGM
ncbi:MAG: dihydrolipoamide acetyltransferase family protein, partial [Thermoplasmata archaeon]